jgi:serine protease inhibitor
MVLSEIKTHNLCIMIGILRSAASLDAKIIVDRPFIFIVRDMVHNIPVLVGRVTNPAADL